MNQKPHLTQTHTRPGGLLLTLSAVALALLFFLPAYGAQFSPGKADLPERADSLRGLRGAIQDAVERLLKNGDDVRRGQGEPMGRNIRDHVWEGRY